MQNYEISALRSLVYRYFMELLDYPYDKDIKVLNIKMEGLRNILNTLSDIPGYQTVADKVKESERKYLSELAYMGRDNFQAEYVSMFELGLPKPVCAPFEREYLSLEKKDDILVSLTEFYEDCGVKAKKATPDHLTVELEFLHYLVNKEFEALRDSNEEEVLELRSKQLDFIENHLAKWIKRFWKCIQTKGTLETYSMLVNALLNFIEADMEFLKSSSIGILR